MIRRICKRLSQALVSTSKEQRHPTAAHIWLDSAKDYEVDSA
jgi:hypothetical protein